MEMTRVIGSPPTGCPVPLLTSQALFELCIYRGPPFLKGIMAQRTIGRMAVSSVARLRPLDPGVPASTALGRRILAMAFVKNLLPLLALWVLPAGSYARQARPADPYAYLTQDSQFPLTVSLFEFHSAFWINLHHFLLLQAQPNAPTEILRAKARSLKRSSNAGMQR